MTGSPLDVGAWPPKIDRWRRLEELGRLEKLYEDGTLETPDWFDEAIEQAMESGPPHVERLEQILPAIGP